MKYPLVALVCLLLAAAVWAAPKNLVANPGFEGGSTGWTLEPSSATVRVAITTNDPHSGSHALLLDATKHNWEVDAESAPMPVTAGTRYRFGVWVKEVAGYGPYKDVIDWRDAHGKHISYANDWTGHNRPARYTLHGGDFAAPAGATQAVLLIGVQKGSAVLMDDFSFVAEPPLGPRLRAYIFSEPRAADGTWPVEAWVCNEGDAPSKPATLRLVCAPGLRVADASRQLTALRPLVRARFKWTLTGKPTKLPAPLSLHVPAGVHFDGDLSTTLFVGIGTMKQVQGMGVPTPHPVQAKPLVGAYYFPVMLDWNRNGWGVSHVPYLTPLLGYYNEALPQVADWHILWAVDHGISFFAYDWYYNDGCLYINDALEKGFLHAKHRSMMKFCINWCNEGQCTWDKPLNFSTKSLCGFMEYLCTHYLNQPEYLRVHGRPVIMIIRPDSIIQWHGGPDGSRKALDAMRQVSEKHGLGDPYFMCMGSADAAALYKRAGYDGITAYDYGFADAPALPNGDRNYDDLPAQYDRIWRKDLAEVKAAGMGYMPAGWTGWDNNARAHKKAIRSLGNTAGRFRETLRLMRKYVDPSLNMVIVEAWNEWGEGGYLEGSKERGLSFLDAIRDVFTNEHGPHIDPAPNAAQRAAYHTDITCAQVDEMYIRRDRERRGVGDLSKPDWTFDKPGDFLGWYHMANVSDAKATAGGLSGTAASNDPMFWGPTLMQVHADAWSALKVRMKTDAAGSGQIFWETDAAPKTTEEASAKFDLIPDGKWHDYVARVGDNPHWRGMVRQLRFDPTNTSGAHFTVASIKGVPR